MTMKSTLLLLSTAVVIVAGTVPTSVPVQAQDWQAREAEILGLHQLCDRGDHRACVRFGIMIGESRERHDELRRRHPEFWWWER
jgi:hypothetical protein